MSPETPLSALLNAGQPEAASQPEVEKPVLDQVRTEPSPEEARAVEAVFAQQQESDTVAGLLGVYTGALILHDLAAETFSPSADEEQEPKRKKDEEEPDEPGN